METCYYCETQHTPMLVYILVDRVNPDHKPRLINVCSVKVDEFGEVVLSDCKDKAIADGYKFSRELTRRR